MRTMPALAPRRTRAPSRRGGRQGRRGSALLLVLTALAIMAVLGSSTVLSTLQEVRIGRRQALQVRAQAVAEYGLNIQLASWPSSRASLAVGATETQQVTVAGGDVATVTVIKLTSAAYLVTSVGRTQIGNGALEAERTVSQVVRQSAVSVAPTSAITMRRSLNLQGSYTISGINTRPTGWSAGECPASSPNTPAVTHHAAYPPSIRKANQVVNGTQATPGAASDATYDDLWNSLVGLASITLASDPNPLPVASGATCTASSTNWGEPFRGGGSVAGCQSRFPVVLLTGNRQLNSGRGQGVLLVDGSLKINGNFDFVGIILVRDEFELLGNANIHGGVYVKGQNGSTSRIQGNGQLTYSSCAVANATNGLGSLARVSQRPWAGLY